MSRRRERSELDDLVRELNQVSNRDRGNEEGPSRSPSHTPVEPAGRPSGSLTEFPAASQAPGRMADASAAGNPSAAMGPLEPASAPLADPTQRVLGGDGPLTSLLRKMVTRKASDLHLVPGLPVILRIDDRLVPLDDRPIAADEISRFFESHLGPREQERLRLRGAVDFSLRTGGSGHGPNDGRFRVNVHRQRGALAANLRALPRSVPTLGELNLPPSLADLVRPRQGLVIVCGPTGSGKSSTLAALIGEINRQRASKIITIEDPIEYEHLHGRSVIEQVEVGVDSPSFAEALRASLRQDPDVVLVGEMRDLETITTALTAAETGHLILSTLHTGDVVQAVHRMVDVFPAAGQSQVRQQLALALTAIVSQRLIPRRDGAGRVPAVEVLRATYPVRQHIRADKLERVYNEITLGQRHGMVSMEASLAELVRLALIDREEALVRTTRPEELASLLGGDGRR